MCSCTLNRWTSAFTALDDICVGEGSQVLCQAALCVCYVETIWRIKQTLTRKLSHILLAALCNDSGAVATLIDDRGCLPVSMGL